MYDGVFLFELVYLYYNSSNMRSLIRRVLKEELGVPAGLLKSADMLYNVLLNNLIRLPLEIDEEENFKIKTDMNISDLNIKNINVVITLIKTEKVEKVEFYSMAFRSGSRLDTEELILINVVNPNTIGLIINFAGPKDTVKKDVIRYFKDDRSNIISSLSHELGHAYHTYKKGITTIKSQSKYAGYSETSFPFSTINRFLHYLYYIHSFENIVRPIEVSSHIETDEVTKEKFYNFITNNQTYKMLKDINDFSYENFRNELKGQSKEIKAFISKIGADVSGLKTEDEIVDELLRIVYINLVNNTLKIAKDILTTNPIENIMGFLMSNKKTFFNKLINYFNRFESNPINFFLHEEKNFKKISDKMIKKISKLYAIAKENKSSIGNWDLHHKINRTGEQFETELKFKTKIK